MDAQCSKEWQQEALRQLLRFEAAVIAMYAAGEKATPKQSFAVVNSALAASLLVTPAFTWRSRPQALAHLAVATRDLCGKKSPSPADVTAMMAVLESSWKLDADARLDELCPDERAAFEVSLEDLRSRSTR